MDIDINRQVITESTKVPVTPVGPEGTVSQPLLIFFQEEAWGKNPVTFLADAKPCIL